MLAASAKAIPPALVSLEPVDDPAAFSALREEWNELLRSSRSDCLFLTWEWLHTWWKHLAAGQRLSGLAVRNADVLIGLAPLAVHSPGFSHLEILPRAEFLGSGYVGSDYLDFIVHSEYESEVIAAIASHLRKKRLLFKWTNLRRRECVAERVSRELQEARWTCAEKRINISPYIKLTGHSWASYQAGLDSEQRYSLNRKWKRLARDFTVEFRQVRTAEECRQGIDLLISLHNARWRTRGGSDAFHTPGLVEFHGDFAQIALRLGWLRLYSLWVDGKPAASLYGFLHRRKFYFYQSGFDPAFEKYGVGVVTMGLAIRSAIEEGAEEYDLLHGDETYKTHWTNTHRELSRLELYPPGVVGSICRTSRHAARTSLSMLRGLTLKGGLA